MYGHGTVKLVRFASHTYDLASMLRAAAEWLETNKSAFVHHLGYSVDDQAEWLVLYYTLPGDKVRIGEVIPHG
jgi:hypothetical protein